jgi:hypothetical protein
MRLGDQNNSLLFVGVNDAIKLNLWSRGNALIFDAPAVLPPGQEGEWLQGYVARKKLTIDHTKVASVQSNFVVWVPIVEDQDIGSHVQDTINGYDIRFTTDDGATLLKYDRETFSISAGQCNASFFVKITTLSHLVDTEIYVYYGSVGAEDGEDPDNVWDTNYVGIWHLNETPNDTYGCMVDSSQQSNHGDPYPFGSGRPVSIAGKLGKTLQFDKVDDMVSINDHVSIRNLTTMSIEIWCRATTDGENNYGRALCKGTSLGSWYISRNAAVAGTMIFNMHWSANWGEWRFPVSLNADHHVCVSYNNSSTGNVPIVVVDGNIVTATEALHPSGSVPDDTGNLFIGNASDGSRTWDGWIDEVRFSNNIRSTDYFITHYRNQNSPSTFYAYGSEELSYSGSGWIDGYSYRKRIEIDMDSVYGTMTDFAVFVKLVLDADLGLHVIDQGNGYDICFAGADGTSLLNYERLSFSIADDLCSFTYFVKVTALSVVADTIIYVYYGKNGASDGSTPNTVWDSDYVGVWHLDNAFAGITDEVVDSTSYANHGTGAPTIETVYSGPTKYVGSVLNDGALFDKIDDRIEVPVASSIDYLTQKTIELWAYPVSRGEGDFGCMISKAAGDYTNGWAFYIRESANVTYRQQFTVANGWWNTTGSPMSTGANHHVMVTFNHSSALNNPVFVIDGIECGITEILVPSGVGYDNPTLPLWIGNLLNTTRTWEGRIDEVRVSKTTRSVPYAQTCYANQKYPTTFLSFQAEERALVSGQPMLVRVRSCYRRLF